MHAFPLFLSLFCHDPNGFEMFAEVKVESSYEYEVKLRNTWGEMPVYQKNIRLSEQGEVVQIFTSAAWESFAVSKLESGWSGHYWYDNSQYILSCKEIP